MFHLAGCITGRHFSTDDVYGTPCSRNVWQTGSCNRPLSAVFGIVNGFHSQTDIKGLPAIFRDFTLQEGWGHCHIESSGRVAFYHIHYRWRMVTASLPRSSGSQLISWALVRCIFGSWRRGQSQISIVGSDVTYILKLTIRGTLSVLAWQ